MAATTPPSSEATKFDAIVLGAGYAGLIAGAILSRNGLKTIVIDELDQVGGRGGATNYHGYWLEFGHRDARDMGADFLMVSATGQYFRKAAEAAGVTCAAVGPIDPRMLIHLLPEGRVIPWSAQPDMMMRYVTEVLDVPRQQADRFLAVIERLATEDPREHLTTTFREWLPSVEEPLRPAFLRMASILASVPPEETSVGGFIQLLRNPSELYKCDDDEVGGIQGFMEPYRRAIREYGGRIELGLKTSEILLQNSVVRGVVTLDRCKTVQVFEAPVVIFQDPVWHVFELLDERLFPADFVANAQKLSRTVGDVIVINLGLSRLPAIRATGRPDTYIGWNRVLRGAERRYGGGWSIPSLVSRKQVPEGKHLLYVAFVVGATEAFGSFEAAKAKVDTTLEYVRQYYRNLDEIIEWQTYNLSTASTAEKFFYKAIPKAPIKAPTIDGLYFLGATDVDGSFEDIQANAALQVTRMVLRGRG